MKQASKAALIISGTAFVAGAAVGIAPFLEQTVQRISNRTEVNEAGMMASDFTGIGPNAAPRLLSPLFGRNSEPGAGPSRVPVVLTEPAEPGPDTIQYAATDLTSLPGGKNFEPTAINNRSEIVGNYRTIEPTEYTVRVADGRRTPSRFRANSRPAVFRAGKFENLPPLPDCNWTFATSINDQGVVVGAARPLKDVLPFRISDGDLPLLRVLRWEKGVRQDISQDFYKVQEMEQDARKSRFSLLMGDPVAINNEGTIFLGARNLYRWRQGTVTRFEASPVRQITGQRMQVNDTGIMVGLVPSPNPTATLDRLMPPGPAIFTNGSGLQPGIINTETGEKIPLGRYSDLPCAVNDAGLVVLSGNRSGNVSQVSLWRNGKAEKIATLPATMTAYINNHGWVVVGDGVQEAPRERGEINPQFGPFLWDSKKLYSLQSLVPTAGGKWAFSQIIGINDQMEILVYAFKMGEQRRHALLLTPK